ncbi:MAG: hypothetical protein KY476_16035 [Planctomycetes bacterium]|nr:hypothetical protein [Planctomycetota bacterium]
MKVLCVTWLLAAGGIAAATSAAAEPANREAGPQAAPAREVPLKDMRKMVIESPVKELVAGTQPDERPAAANPPQSSARDSGAAGATLAETAPADNPTVEPLKGSDPFAGVPSAQVLYRSSAKGSDPVRQQLNPTVEPGRVRWLADFDAARATAARSGRPVLLFQLMGRLDQRFT